MTDHIDYKTASIDESFPVATAILFGADHQDTATPGPFDASVIADAFDARESTLTNKTLVTPQIAAIYNGAYTYDMPAGTGTLARLEDIGAGSYTSPMTARGEMLRRGASADEAFEIGTSGYALLSNGTDPAWTGYTPGGAGGATRSWIDKSREFVSAVDYGAVGDDSTDDTSDIQALLDAHLNVHFGGPQYVYRVAGTLTLRDGHRIDLRGATIHQTASQTPLFDASSKSDIAIENGTLQGHGNDYLDSASSQAVGVKTNGTTNIQVRGCRFEDFCYSPFAGVATKANGVYFIGNVVVGPGEPVLTPNVSRNNNGVLAYGNNILIANNDISYTGQGVYIAQESENFIVTGNNIHDITVEHGMYLDSGLVNGSVTGNTVRNFYQTGIKYQYYDGVAKQPKFINISNNVISGSTAGEGIMINNSIPSGVVYRGQGVIVSNNVISGIAQSYGLNLRYAEGIQCCGNHIYDCYGGIYFAQLTGGSIVGNHIRFTKFNGIIDAGTSSFVNIIGNHIYDPGRNGSVDAYSCAILITGGSSHLIQGNYVQGISTRMQHGLQITGGTQSTFIVRQNVLRGAKDYGAALLAPATTILSFEGNIMEGVIGSGNAANEPQTVALLPSAAVAGRGARRFVTDATSTTYHATVAGGGGNKVSLVSDGTNWLIS